MDGREAGAKTQSIPVDLIDVANPRARNQRIFEGIVASIAAVGLKRPITVAARPSANGIRYDLVCGQGRLEAFRRLGQTTIPALVVEADAEQLQIMSLVENLARRQHHALDLLHDIQGMQERGHSEADIARKTGLTNEYVRGVLRLINRSETRLLVAVEKGTIPVSIAVDIALAADTDTQRVLQEAYEKNLLRGHKLIAAKRLVEQRRRHRRLGGNSDRGERARPLSVNALVRTYQQDTEKKRLIVRRALATRDRLVFVLEALRTLMSDTVFMRLLEAEQIETLPRSLSERLRSRGAA
ncbi:plasmid partitioning protein RepB C-terminal domain-containing protein [Siccirubricoccus phaeus]|uniref:plasmid partitioning protein RepB C-terminal domain-containing protein n=1 Tax=Siccirubricoccus phaeus TaxID=2595053 RepID=UPI001F1E6A69|nr:plasmid partitioning protein RepB C-terminal domain-containing protein [Siccirubricoccus phaeus]